MKFKASSFLKDYSSDIKSINRLIVSSFLKANNLNPQSKFLDGYKIKSCDEDYEAFFKFSDLLNINTLESVIEAFELVVSPKDKVVTGAVYTPLFIREYITNYTLSKIEKDLDTIFIADISCGCGGFLLTSAKWLFLRKKTTYTEIIKKNLWGLDIADYSVERTKIVLSLLALENGEDANIQFNIFLGNALNFSWQDMSQITQSGGFDVVIGNPPYVASRNIDEESLGLLHKWDVTRSGHPDLYIPFFQIGMNSLSENGILGFITVNTFFKSVNGRALRSYFSKEKFDLTIIDFRGEQIFNKKSTYTCLCFIKKACTSQLKFYQTISKNLDRLSEDDFQIKNYKDFNHFEGWNLVDSKSLNIVQKLEQFDTNIFSKFSFSTGIATLKNSIFKFKSIKESKDYFALEFNGRIFQIEKIICKEIINANKVTTEEKINELVEKIIFPYSYDKRTNKYNVISEDIMKKKFPFAYVYLLSRIDELAKRDKGKGKYEAWYAFGRNQGLQINGIKLFLPHITNNPHFVISHNKNLFFCNGEAIVSDDEVELRILKRILESDVFWFYIQKTSKPYSSGFYSLSRNYIKRFSIPDFLDHDRQFLLTESDDSKILIFLLQKYGIPISHWKEVTKN